MKFSTELPIMPIKLVLINDYMAHMPYQSNHKTPINELQSFSLSKSMQVLPYYFLPSLS